MIVISVIAYSRYSLLNTKEIGEINEDKEIIDKVDDNELESDIDKQQNKEKDVNALFDISIKNINHIMLNGKRPNEKTYIKDKKILEEFTSYIKKYPFEKSSIKKDFKDFKEKLTLFYNEYNRKIILVSDDYVYIEEERLITTDKEYIKGILQIIDELKESVVPISYTINRIDNDTGELTYNHNELTDEIFKCKIEFEIPMNKESVEKAIKNNIYSHDTKYFNNKTEKLPIFEFEWKTDQELYITLKNLVVGNKYNIDMNRAKGKEGRSIATDERISSVIGGIYLERNAIYDFVVTRNQVVLEYDIKTNDTKEIIDIGNDTQDIGPISKNNSWILLGIYDEWIYYPTLFNIDTGKSVWLGDKISKLYYEGPYLSESKALFPRDSKIIIYDYLKDDIKNINFDEKYGFSSIKENPYNETTGILGYEDNDSDYSDEIFILLDEEYNEINKIYLNLDSISETYGSYYDFWWFDENHICISGRDSKKQINTYTINVHDGEIVRKTDKTKIGSISSDKILLYDISNEENISINLYDKEFNLLNSIKQSEYKSTHIYGTRFIWYENKIYFTNLGTDEKTFIWNYETNGKSYISIDYENYVLLDVVKDGKILILTNSSELSHMSP